LVDGVIHPADEIADVAPVEGSDETRANTEQDIASYDIGLLLQFANRVAMTGDVYSVAQHLS
jgi:hypothetical protein